MITQSEVNYSEEIIENLSVSDIREIYAESLLMFFARPFRRKLQSILLSGT